MHHPGLTGNMIADGLETCSCCGGISRWNPCAACSKKLAAWEEVERKATKRGKESK